MKDKGDWNHVSGRACFGEACHSSFSQFPFQVKLTVPGVLNLNFPVCSSKGPYIPV